MTSNEEIPRTQHREGPWRKMTDHVDTERDVHERWQGKTGKDRFDELYGEGNWAFDEAEYKTQNETDRMIARQENELASEGLRNVIASNMTADALGIERLDPSLTYVDDEGNSLHGRVRRQVVGPRMGHLIVSPDGDAHFAEKIKDKKDNQ